MLVGLANYAGPDGTGAFPSVATLVRYTGLAERTVRSCLDRLEADGIIAPCNPDIVAARIKRADRRPQGWDLNLGLVRDDLGELGKAEPASQPSARKALPAERRQRVRDDHLDGVQPLHPGARTGCNQRTTGVQPAQPRGAAVAPEPYVEPSIEPSALAWLSEGPSGRDGIGGGPVAEFFAALADSWRLTAVQRARLAPAVDAALRVGWTPAELAAHTGANAESVRSPYAALAARLSPPSCPRRRQAQRGRHGAASATSEHGAARPTTALTPGAAPNATRWPKDTAWHSDHRRTATVDRRYLWPTPPERTTPHASPPRLHRVICEHARPPSPTEGGLRVWMHDTYTCILICMSRKPLANSDRDHGRRLGLLIAAGRQERRQSAPDLAQESAVAVDTVRSLESGRVPTPAFLTVARLASALGMSLDELHRRAQAEPGPDGRATR